MSLEKAKDKLGMGKMQLSKAISLTFNFAHLQQILEALMVQLTNHKDSTSKMFIDRDTKFSILEETVAAQRDRLNLHDEINRGFRDQLQEIHTAQDVFSTRISMTNQMAVEVKTKFADIEKRFDKVETSTLQLEKTLKKQSHALTLLVNSNPGNLNFEAAAGSFGGADLEEV
jgi:hypothetical protein